MSITSVVFYLPPMSIFAFTVGCIKLFLDVDIAHLEYGA